MAGIEPNKINGKWGISSETGFRAGLIFLGNTPLKRGGCYEEAPHATDGSYAGIRRRGRVNAGAPVAGEGGDQLLRE